MLKLSMDIIGYHNGPIAAEQVIGKIAACMEDNTYQAGDAEVV